MKSTKRNKMKKSILYFISITFLVLTFTANVWAQQVRTALKGDAYVIKKGESAALEIGGKIVLGFDKGFTDIKTATGKYFVGNLKDKNFYLFDRSGKEVQLGKQGTKGYDKISLIDGTIVATDKGVTRYYSEQDITVEIKPQATGHDFFEKQIEKKTGQPVFNPEKMAQAKATEQAEYLSSLVRADGRFEIRPKPNSNRQQIFVKGKMLHEAQEYKVVSDPEYWNKTGCWALIAKNGGNYGAILLVVYEEGGKKEELILQVIPYKYSFISHHGGNMLDCTTRSGAPHYFNFGGWNFDSNWRTGQFTPTYKKWVHNKSTDEWTFQKQEEKK